MEEKKIESIVAKEIFDLKQKSAIEVTVTSSGVSASFTVPFEANTGVYGVHILDTKIAIDKVNTVIAPALIGKNILNQQEIDTILIALDGTKNKENLGGNAMIGVSIACAKCAAKISNMEMYAYLRTLKEIKASRTVPYLYMSLVSGGTYPKDKLSFEQYLIVPIVSDPEAAFKIGVDIKNSLKEIIFYALGSDSVLASDEGGFLPRISDVAKPFEFLSQAILKNGQDIKVRLALRAGATSFYQDGQYEVGGSKISKDELMSMYGTLMEQFNLLSIEDPFNEEDLESFAMLKTNHPKIIVTGGDITATNSIRIKEVMENRCIGAMTIKPCQAGTLSETLDTMKLARENSLELIISGNTNETMDTFIADLAYAFGVFGLASGAPEIDERDVKYLRLIEINNSKK